MALRDELAIFIRNCMARSSATANANYRLNKYPEVLKLFIIFTYIYNIYMICNNVYFTLLNSYGQRKEKKEVKGTEREKIKNNMKMNR